MVPEDEEKIVFVTDRGLYCYRVIPFGLKNAGATYQQLVDKIFRDQLGRNIERCILIACLSRAKLPRTTQRLPIAETSFNLASGIEVVIPVEFGLPSLKVEEYNEDTNSVWLHANLDLIKESKECAAVRMTAYCQRVARYYNFWVKLKEFRAGDLVLRRAKVSQPIEQGKLSPN